MKSVFLLCAFSIASGVGAAGSATAGAPEITWMRGGHVGVAQIALSTDDATLATAGASDNTLKLWNAQTGEIIRTLAAHIGNLRSVAYSPDGQYVASAAEYAFGSDDLPLKIWRTSDGTVFRQFGQMSQADAITFSPNGSLVAASQGTTIRVYRVSDGALVRTFTGHSWFIFGLRFSPSGALLASASGDRTVKIWQISTGTLLRTFTGHTSFVESVAFSPSGDTLVSGSFDQSVRLWRVSDGTPLLTIPVAGAVYGVAYAPNGSVVASAEDDDVVRLSSTADGSLVRALSEPELQLPNSVAFASDGATLYCGGFDGHCRAFRVSDGALLRTFGYHTARVASVAFTPDGAIAGTGSHDFQGRLWSVSDGALLARLIGHDDVVNSIAFSSDGALAATAAGSPPPDTRDPSIKIWRVSDGALLQTLSGHVGGSTSVSFSSNGQWLASGGRDGAVKLWSQSDWSLIRVMQSGSTPSSVLFAPDGETIGSGSEDAHLDVWHAADGVLLHHFPLDWGVKTIAWAPSGQTIGCALDKYGDNVEIRDATTGSLVRSFPGHAFGFATDVAFTPDGAVLASTSGYTYEIALWSVADGSQVALYNSETGWGEWIALPIAFSPDASHFLYGRADATVVLAATPAYVTAVSGGGAPSASALRIGPNPFATSTTLDLTLASPATIDVRIYDAGGRSVRLLTSGARSAGTLRLRWDGRDDDGRRIAPGVYECRVLADGRRLAIAPVLVMR